MDTNSLIDKNKKKLLPSIIPVINSELKVFLKMELDKIRDKLVIENNTGLAAEMDRLKQESDHNKTEKEELDQLRIEYLNKSKVLEEKLEETNEHMNATKKVSIYQRYEKTIVDKNTEIKIMSFRVKSLEEQLRKAKEKNEKSTDIISNNEILSEELEPELEPKSKIEPEPRVEEESKIEPEGADEKSDTMSEQEEETELEWVLYKKKNYLTDNDYLYNEDDLDKVVGYKTKKGNWKLY